MTGEFSESRRAALSDLLTDLANEIDGLADMGVTVCLIDQKLMAGRHGFLTRHETAIQDLVKSIIAVTGSGRSTPPQQLLEVQAELINASTQLRNAFISLEDFRDVDPETLLPVTEALRSGWEDVHRSIRNIATMFGLLGEEWYSDVVDRQDSYRERLKPLFTLMSEAARGFAC